MANAWLLKPLPIIGVSSPTTSTAIGAFLNVANDYAGVIWQSPPALFVNGPITLDLDLGFDQAFDTILIFGVAGVPITGVVVVTVVPTAGGLFEGSFESSGQQPLYAGSAMPVSGLGVSVLSAPTGVNGFNRRVRLQFLGTGANDYLRISRMVVGKRIQLERNFGFGGSFGVRDLGSTDFSRRGVLLRQRGAKLRTTALTFSHIRKDEVEATTKPLLEQLGNTDMVGLVLDPAPHAQRQNRCYYGPLVGDLGHTQRNAAGWEAKINLVSVF